MKTKGLPHRFSEVSFRRYEPFIERALDVWPEPVEFQTDSIETFSCRFRDAIRSVLDNRWTTTIDLDKLQKSHLVVRHNEGGGSVTVSGPKKRPGRPPGVKTSAPYSNAEPVVNASDELLNAIALCLHHKVWLTPIYLIGTSEEKLHALEERYDVSYVLKENGYLLI